LANVTQYHVVFYGGFSGYQGSRAQITLYDGTIVLGYVRFHDTGMPFPADSLTAGRITMNLPSGALGNVLEMLRNEKPIYYYFASGLEFLGTSTEPVGETE
jgi:hypothetical protein